MIISGEIADGALSWLCPVPYLLRTGLTTLRRWAAAGGRSAPPLVAHILVALTTDRQVAIAVGHRLIDVYTRYRNVHQCGFPTTFGGALVDNLPFGHIRK